MIKLADKTIENTSSEFVTRRAFAQDTAKNYSLAGGCNPESNLVYLVPSENLPLNNLKKLVYDQGYYSGIIKRFGKWAVSILGEIPKTEGARQ